MLLHPQGQRCIEDGVSVARIYNSPSLIESILGGNLTYIGFSSFILIVFLLFGLVGGAMIAVEQSAWSVQIHAPMRPASACIVEVVLALARGLIIGFHLSRF